MILYNFNILALSIIMKFKIITGSAGFIGSSVSIKLLERGDNLIGIDNHNDYYDPKLKKARLERHIENKNYTHIVMDIQNAADIDALFKNPNLCTLFSLKLSRIIFSATVMFPTIPSLWRSSGIRPIPALTTIFGVNFLTLEVPRTTSP